MPTMTAAAAASVYAAPSPSPSLNADTGVSDKIKMNEEEEMRMIGEQSRKLANAGAANAAQGRSWESSKSVTNINMNVQKSGTTSTAKTGFILENAPADLRRQQNQPSSNYQPQQPREQITSAAPALDPNRMTGVPTQILSTESSTQLKQLTGASTSIDLSSVSENLKCPLSGKLLTDAVELPCCGKACSAAAVHPLLVSSGLKCPICSTENVSPDNLIVRQDLRDETTKVLSGSNNNEILNEITPEERAASAWASSTTSNATSAIAKAWGQPMAGMLAGSVGNTPMGGQMGGGGWGGNPMANPIGMGFNNPFLGMTQLPMGHVPPDLESQLPPVLTKEDFELERAWQLANPNASLEPPMPPGGFMGGRGGRGFRGRGGRGFRGRGRGGRGYDNRFDNRFDDNRSDRFERSSRDKYDDRRSRDRSRSRERDYRDSRGSRRERSPDSRRRRSRSREGRRDRSRSRSRDRDRDRRRDDKRRDDKRDDRRGRDHREKKERSPDDEKSSKQKSIADRIGGAADGKKKRR